MTLEKAIKMVATEYAVAEKLEFVRNPLAYALYRVWKIADQKPPRNRRIKAANEDRCICCGAIIPEGRLVCPLCEEKEDPDG